MKQQHMDMRDTLFFFFSWKFSSSPSSKYGKEIVRKVLWGREEIMAKRH